MKLPISESEIIKKFIPQREPIIMVQTLLEYKNQYVKTSIKIDQNNIFVQNNKLTEAGLIEHMAQSVAIYTGFDFFIKNQNPPTGYIGAIKKVEINELPNINDLVVTEVHILHDILGVTLVDIFSKCNDLLIATAQMKTVIAN